MSGGDMRCGRCLVLVTEKTFLHDCAGMGLEPEHYVERLEGELARLGEGMTALGLVPVGAESAVDAALRSLAGLLGAQEP